MTGERTIDADAILREKDPRRLISSFDSVFDLSGRQRDCLETLGQLGVLAPPKDGDASALANYVGGAWCQMVSADVSYDLWNGVLLVHQSGPYGKRLAELCERDPLGRDVFDNYVAARWYDGAAKVRFRSGYFTEARIWFGKALDLGRRAGLWHVLPDLESNFLRGQFDEQREWIESDQLAVLRTELDREYGAAFARAEAVAGQWGIALPDRDGESQEPTEPRSREFLRGVSSLLHNHSMIVLANGELERALELSERNEANCRSQRDDYRLGQAILLQARLAERQRQFDLAQELLKEVAEKIKWERGTYIGWQHFYRLEGRLRGLESRLEAWNRLLEMLEGLREKRRELNGDIVLDVESEYFTVQALEEILTGMRDLGEFNEAGDLRRQLEARLHREELDMMRSLRQVVEVISYKNAFAKKFYPRYLQLLSDLLDRDMQDRDGDRAAACIDEAFALVEEASCRELLDTLAAASNLSFS